MKNLKMLWSLLIICFVLAIVSIIIIFLPLVYEKPNINNTRQIEVTLTGLENKDNSVILYTSEYNCKLIIRDKSSVIDQEAFNQLSLGDKVRVRIENKYFGKIQEANFIYISALEFDNVEIISLESNNKLLHRDDLKIQITACIFTSIFIIIGITCAILIHKNKKLRS